MLKLLRSFYFIIVKTHGACQGCTSPLSIKEVRNHIIPLGIFFMGSILYSYHLYSVWVHFIMCFQWYMIFVFQSVPTPHSAALLQLGILLSNYWGTGLLENLAGDVTGDKATVKGFSVLRYGWREQRTGS